MMEVGELLHAHTFFYSFLASERPCVPIFFLYLEANLCTTFEIMRYIVFGKRMRQGLILGTPSFSLPSFFSLFSFL